MIRSFYKWLTLLCLGMFLFACNSQRNATSKKERELRDMHAVKIKLIRAGLDPTKSKVPDSMKHWIPVFANVLANDQQYRIVGVRMKNSERISQNRLDSLNRKVVFNFLEKYGWPAVYDAGFVSQRAINMVIQHSPLAVQEKYYPFLVKTYSKDSSLFEILAMMEDRINMRNLKPQFYGTQIIFLDGKATIYPLVNVDSLETFRRRLGNFLPYQQYAALFQISWDPKRYKEMLPGLKRRLKISENLGINHYRDSRNNSDE